MIPLSLDGKPHECKEGAKVLPNEEKSFEVMEREEVVGINHQATILAKAIWGDFKDDKDTQIKVMHYENVIAMLRCRK